MLVTMWITVPLLASTLLAQQVLPVGVTRGSLVAWQGSPSSGSVVVRRSDGELYGCSFDAHTLFQRNQSPVSLDALHAGEPVEVVSDRRPASSVPAANPEASGNCYARLLSVVDATAGAVRREGLRAPAAVPALRGYLTFAGVVLRADASEMTIRTRDGDRTLLLRGDTRYSENGMRLEEEPATLVNRHVFVRGGRTLDGDLQAYQVMWGEIFAAP